ncbi:MAG: hypothetical protein V3T70_03780 [Phycisphaerae bacterium]
MKKQVQTIPFILLCSAIWLGWFGWYRFTTRVVLHQEKDSRGNVLEQGPVIRQADEAYKRHGLWLAYHADGSKKSETRYDNGARHGVHTIWNEEGQKILEELWERDQLVSASINATQPAAESAGGP